MCPLTRTYSIRREFDDSVVFITGASGFIGSVVLEQLLRTTNVRTIYLLMRARRGESIQERADKLLQGALFHKVRDSIKLLKKVKVVGGDIMESGLGMSSADKGKLISSVDYIIHCAADIRLEADIQETLTANFEGTRAVLEFAAAAGHLKALVHVSSAFVNINQPRSSVVDEQVYPLKYGHQVVDVEQLSQEFMSLPKRDANHRAEVLMRMWKFPNTYTMGKHMSEQLVTRYQAKQQLPVAIVRPSLVSAIAGEPYPGYVGNWAGPIGAGAAMAIGLFDCLESVASQPMGVWDIVPADLVASAILAAAASISAGVAAAISRATKSGSVIGTACDAAVVLGQPHLFTSAAHAAHVHQTVAVATAGQFVSPDLAATVKLPIAEHDSAVTLKASPPAVAKGLCSSRALSPRSDDTAMSAAGSTADLLQVTDALSDSCSVSSIISSPKLRSSIARCSGRAAVKATEQLLDTVAVSSHMCDDMHSEESQLSEGVCDDHQSRQPLLIVHAATSTTYPLTLMEGWNYNLDFFDAHPPPFRICLGAAPHMTASFVPTDANVMACRRRIWWKVWAISTLLTFLGKQKEAKKLMVGFDTFCVHNNSKTDRDLKFSTHTLVALEAALAPAEASDYMLVWRPMINHSSSSSKNEANQKSQTGAKPFVAAAGCKGADAESRAVAGVTNRFQNALVPVAGNIIWRRYLHTQMAGIYRMLYGVVVEQHKVMGSAAAKATQECTELTDECFIEHDFKRIK